MMSRLARTHSLPMTRQPRTVAVVSREIHPQVLETLLEAGEHDVVFVESTAHAYSQIKRVSPDLVIVCMSGDDLDGCQVLSMLALDSETSGIPVITCVTSSCGRASDVIDHGPLPIVPVSMN